MFFCGGGVFLKRMGSCIERPLLGNNRGPGQPYTQLVVSSQHHAELMLLPHDGPFAGHLGVQKTYDRLKRNFYWPEIQNDMRDYCRSCAVCQKRKQPIGPQKAPLHSLPMIQEAFLRVAMNTIGPMWCPTQRGNKYIFCQ